ncbi:MAG: glycosyltransferase family 4 protein [Candidatus Aminicenantia bacterium]
MRIKVCHIITKLELGGAQKNTLYTVSSLNPSIFETYLISGEAGLLDKKAMELLGERAIFVREMRRSINPFYDFLALIKLTITLRKIKPQIIHTHSSKAGILGRWAGFFAGVKIRIHTVHGFGFSPFHHFLIRKLFIFLEKLTSLVTTHFICVSKNNLTNGIKLKIIKEERASIIRSGVEIERFTNAKVDIVKKKKELGIPNNKKIIGIVACFKPQKAPLDFVRIAKLLKEMRDDLHFVMIGDGELRGSIEKEILSLGLKEDLSLLGWREDVEEVLKTLDTLVLTSLWEGLPQVIPQAYASGVPMVVTDVDGNKEFVEDGVNGFTFKPNDIEDATNKIFMLLQSSELKERFVREGRKKLDEFNSRVMLKKQEELYLNLLDKLNKRA